jgi:hypothetical protein
MKKIKKILEIIHTPFLFMFIMAGLILSVWKERYLNKNE